VLGSDDLDDPFLDALVAATGCVAVSVVYRLGLSLRWRRASPAI
jgi:acetyl esterase/lipase